MMIRPTEMPIWVGCAGGRLRNHEAAIYFRGWNRLGMKGSVPQCKDVGCGGPTLYPHAEDADFGFRDRHAERLHKERVWVQKDWDSVPKQPGMWVARLELWNKYR